VVASLLLALVVIASMSRLARRVRTWPREALAGRVVRITPRLGPATIGLVHPEIVIPRWASGLPSDELELVLAHEEEHVRTRDPLLLTLGLAAAVACPWNALIWWQHRRLKDAVEVDCDQRVLQRGAAAPRYGDLLVKVGSRGGSHLLPLPTMTGSTSLLERRLTAMKTLKLRAALPRALGATVAALGLVVVACGTEPPVGAEDAGATRAEASQQERNALVVDLWLEPDGSVYVNDELRAMEDVSDVVGTLRAASQGTLVVSIAGDPQVPYRVMAELQRELQASGATRVVFGTSDTRPSPTPPGDVEDVMDGLALVLPSDGMRVPVSGRNVLHLVVRPSGMVDVIRGPDRPVQRMRAEEIEALWRREVATNANLIAAVKTHPDASYTRTLDVLDALQAADAQRISLQMMTN
jgi:biopolymer transport protein ExbD